MRGQGGRETGEREEERGRRRELPLVIWTSSLAAKTPVAFMLSFPGMLPTMCPEGSRKLR